MLIKFMDKVINTKEIKYMEVDRYGWSSSKYNGAYMPLVTIRFIDNELLKIRLEDRDIEEYKKFENIVLNSQ